MPRELVAVGPRAVETREYEEPPLGSGEVRVESAFAAIKHGTGMRKYRGESRDYEARFDPDRRIHVEGEPGEGHLHDGYPFTLGNMTVGTVRETGEAVDRFDAGDRVYGYLPIRETHAVPADQLDPVPDGMDPEAVVYLDPAYVALNLVRDAGIAVGDTAAVFGGGAIGQMAAQIARRQGASTVVVSEPLDRRRDAAGRHGADVLLDPTETDAGLAIKDRVRSGEEAGVDVSIETSAAYAGLDDAVRATALEGTVITCSYYASDPGELTLGGEWHRNNLTVITRPREHTDHPRWPPERRRETAFGLLRDGALSVAGLVDPVLPFAEADDAYRLIDESPGETVKVGISFET